MHLQGNCNSQRCIGFILDRSGSMSSSMGGESRLEAVVQATRHAAYTLEATDPNCLLFVVAFDTEADVVVPVALAGRDASFIRGALGTIKSRGGTDFGAGLRAALNTFESLGLSAQSQGLIRRAGGAGASPLLPFEARALFLSDGQDCRSESLPLVGRIQDLGVTLCTVGVGRRRDQVNESLLRQMASIGPDGQPLYSWITDGLDLQRRFVEVATGIMKSRG